MAHNLAQDLDAILAEIEKTAAGTVSQKQIVDKPGDPDDGTKPTTEGARAAENSADVKAKVPNSTDGSPTAPERGATQTNPLLAMGTKATMTGEGGAAEEVKKDKPYDSGTANKDLQVDKKASVKEVETALLSEIRDLLKKAEEEEKAAASKTAEPVTITDATMAGTGKTPEVKVEKKDETKLEDKEPASTGKTPEGKTCKDKCKTAEEKEAEAKLAAVVEDLTKNNAEDIKAGYDLAKQVGDEIVKVAEQLEKVTPEQLKKLAEAQEAQDAEIVANIVKSAQVDAQITAETLISFAATLDKQAGVDPAMLEAGAPAAAEAGEQVPAEELAALEAGAAPEVAPEAGVGGEEGLDENNELVKAIVEALAQEGVTPEELMAAAGGEGEAAPKMANDKAKLQDAVKKLLSATKK